jgi:hypothetical protein
MDDEPLEIVDISYERGGEAVLDFFAMLLLPVLWIVAIVVILPVGILTTYGIGFGRFSVAFWKRIHPVSEPPSSAKRMI